jgi:hypothetical protein
MPTSGRGSELASGWGTAGPLAALALEGFGLAGEGLALWRGIADALIRRTGRAGDFDFPVGRLRFDFAAVRLPASYCITGKIAAAPSERTQLTASATGRVGESSTGRIAHPSRPSGREGGAWAPRPTRTR